MIYITSSDLETHIKAGNLQNMIDQVSALQDTAEQAALSQLKAYLMARYDWDAEMAKTGTDRNAHLVRSLIYVMLYILHERLPKRTMPEHIRNNYLETITFFERVSDGKTDIDMARLTDIEGTPKSKFRSGSDTPRTYPSNY